MPQRAETTKREGSGNTIRAFVPQAHWPSEDYVPRLRNCGRASPTGPACAKLAQSSISPRPHPYPTNEHGALASGGIRQPCSKRSRHCSTSATTRRRNASGHRTTFSIAHNPQQVAGLLALIKRLPPTPRYGPGVTLSEKDYVLSLHRSGSTQVEI